MPTHKKKAQRQTNTLRIIGGVHRGRRLSFPDGEGLRPTTDRVRETVFNWLQNSIQGAHCVDFFSGSGALGIEAASRGAARVVLLDINPIAIDSLQKHVQTLQLNNVEIVKQDARQWLRQRKKEELQQYDIFFIDPPFAKHYLLEILDVMNHDQALKAGAEIYLESDIDLETIPLPSTWVLGRHKKAGDVYYGLIVVNGQAE